MARPSTAPGFPALVVRYYRRMKPRKVYPVEVRWGSTPRPIGTVKQVTVRLLAAGAQVVPKEQILDASRPELGATFFVTPLADGWLRAQRLEVVLNDKKVQELPLATKVVRRRWALFFLILAFALPWLLTQIKYAPANWLTEALATTVPTLPDFVTNSVPDAANWLKLGEEWIGARYADLHDFVGARNVIFPTIVVCVLLAIWGWFHGRDRRGKRWTNPIPVTAT
jgi:hypothetical protein